MKYCLHVRNERYERICKRRKSKPFTINVENAQKIIYSRPKDGLTKKKLGVGLDLEKKQFKPFMKVNIATHLYQIRNILENRAGYVLIYRPEHGIAELMVYLPTCFIMSNIRKAA